MESSISFFVEQERPRGNHGREGRKDRVLTHDTQRWLLISSSSSDENPSISNLPNLTSMHSLMTLIFHLSSLLTGWYSMLLIPTSLSWSTLFLPDSSIILRRLYPVTLLTLFWMVLSSIFVTILLDFLICLIKFRNRFIRIRRTCVLSETGSIIHLWVAYGRSYITFTDLFQFLPSSAQASSQAKLEGWVSLIITSLPTPTTHPPGIVVF